MNWFRFYSGALDDPKVQRLPAETFRGWVNLMCLANESEPRGFLPSIEDIAFRLRMDEPSAGTLISTLIERGLLDCDDETLRPHNWDGRQRQSDDVASRVQKHRAKQDETPDPVTRNVTRNTDVTVALDRTEQIQRQSRTETEQTETRAPADDAPAPPEDESLEITQTAEILTDAPFVGDGYADVLPAVRRSFGLVPEVRVRDGPLLAEQFANWRGYRKKPPADWYRAWLNWLKRERDDERNRTTTTGPTIPAKPAGYGFDAAVEARQTPAAPG